MAEWYQPALDALLSFRAFWMNPTPRSKGPLKRLLFRVAQNLSTLDGASLNGSSRFAFE